MNIRVDQKQEEIIKPIKLIKPRRIAAIIKANLYGICMSYEILTLFAYIFYIPE